jgi:transaldolase
MKAVSELSVKLFADGADAAQISRAVRQTVPDRPVSLEVFADEFPEMQRQARKIDAWGDNVYVKIPLKAAAVELLRMYSNVELIWASPRELLNLWQADAIGCHIITVTSGILSKLELIGPSALGDGLAVRRDVEQCGTR